MAKLTFQNHYFSLQCHMIFSVTCFFCKPKLAELCELNYLVYTSVRCMGTHTHKHARFL